MTNIKVPVTAVESMHRARFSPAALYWASVENEKQSQLWDP